MKIYQEKPVRTASKAIRTGKPTRKKLAGYAKELLELLDVTIREEFSCYEPLRRYVRIGCDPLCRTVLRACQDNGFRLEIGYWSRTGDGIEEEHKITTSRELKKLCSRLRERLTSQPGWRETLSDLKLPIYRVYSWTRKESNDPRFGDIVRLADKLGYYIKWYDKNTKRNVEVF